MFARKVKVSVPLSIMVLLVAACGSADRAITPVIYAHDDDAALAMKSAPYVLVVKIASVKLMGQRMVEKPPEVGGPMVPKIPLTFARIRADVLFAVHGDAEQKVEFYSWIWATGSHGGPRLFHPDPGAVRVVFLTRVGKYLHTVGDYPSYDVELSSSWVPGLLTLLRSKEAISEDVFERLVALRLRAEFESLSASDIDENFKREGPISGSYHVRGLSDLVRLVGPLFVATQLDSICEKSENPFARIGACLATYEYAPGRCRAYETARIAADSAHMSDLRMPVNARCTHLRREVIQDMRKASASWGIPGTVDPSLHRREIMRVYASAMDTDIHSAACEIAATVAELQDIPECAAPRPTRQHH